MALSISSVPVLTGEACDQFEKKIEQNEMKHVHIDFSKQIEIAKKILGKAKLQ